MSALSLLDVAAPVKNVAVGQSSKWYNNVRCLPFPAWPANSA